MRLLEDRVSDVHHVIHDYRGTTPGMEHAVLVSSGGLVLASSGPAGPGIGGPGVRGAHGVPGAHEAAEAAHAERLAALTSSLLSLARAATEAYGGGAPSAIVVNAERHHLCLMPVDGDTGLAVLASADADLGHIMYVAALLARELASLVDGDTRAHLCRMFLSPG